jgi:hypothetical protein
LWSHNAGAYSLSSTGSTLDRALEYHAGKVETELAVARSAGAGGVHPLLQIPIAPIPCPGMTDAGVG